MKKHILLSLILSTFSFIAFSNESNPIEEIVKERLVKEYYYTDIQVKKQMASAFSHLNELTNEQGTVNVIAHELIYSEFIQAKDHRKKNLIENMYKIAINCLLNGHKNNALLATCSDNQKIDTLDKVYSNYWDYENEEWNNAIAFLMDSFEASRKYSNQLETLTTKAAINDESLLKEVKQDKENNPTNTSSAIKE